MHYHQCGDCWPCEPVHLIGNCPMRKQSCIVITATMTVKLQVRGVGVKMGPAPADDTIPACPSIVC
jgi:hypothetical protein